MTTKYVAKKDEFNLVALDNSFAIWALGLKPIIADRKRRGGGRQTAGGY